MYRWLCAFSRLPLSFTVVPVQCVHHPICYFPVFYLLRGTMNGEAPQDSLAKYQTDLWENMKALWMVWVPAQVGLQQEAQSIALIAGRTEGAACQVSL